MENKKLVIAWYPASNGGLSFRGSEVSLFSYAHFAEKLLGHKSIICLQMNAFNEPSVLKIFEERFSIVRFDDVTDLETCLIDKKVDAFYSIRSGRQEFPLLEKIPMLIHCVYDMSDAHGLVYAGVSKTIADKYNKSAYVPHMVHLEDSIDTYRKELGIAQNAIVFGRHGGVDTFDLPMAKEAILKILSEKENIYFLFAVRPLIFQDVSHKRLICLEPFADLLVKRKFVNTCNAMIHAQSLGESFGLACAEMSMCNKPVITWDGGVCQEHLRILGDKCIKYKSANELYDILSNFNPIFMAKKNWKAYQDFTPVKVMAKFDKVFLNPLKEKLSS